MVDAGKESRDRSTVERDGEVKRSGVNMMIMTRGRAMARERGLVVSTWFNQHR
jgi:hypothetical protein